MEINEALSLILEALKNLPHRFFVKIDELLLLTDNKISEPFLIGVLKSLKDKGYIESNSLNTEFRITLQGENTTIKVDVIVKDKSEQNQESATKSAIDTIFNKQDYSLKLKSIEDSTTLLILMVSLDIILNIIHFFR